jgi:hypothetical protein
MSRSNLNLDLQYDSTEEAVVDYMSSKDFQDELEVIKALEMLNQLMTELNYLLGE